MPEMSPAIAPQPQSTMLIDQVLLVWFSLSAIAVIYVAWDALTRNPELTIMKWGWILVTLYTGIVGAALYILSCQEPAPGEHEEFVKPLWKQTLGSTIHCMAGDATGIIVAAAITAVLGLPMQRLLPDLSDRSEIEVDLLSKLVLACGDVSLIQFVRRSRDAIVAARDALKAGCTIIGDIFPVVSALDQTRLAHLNCSVETLIADAHINSADEAEKAFWNHKQWEDRLERLPEHCILVIGYAPSVLMSACTLIEQRKIRPALVIGMPIGFSHAPAAKRRLMKTEVPYLTIAGTLGGGLLAAVSLNALVESLIEKPDCHCYLSSP